MLKVFDNERIKEAKNGDSTIKKLNNVWLLPKQWNQPGFDLFCLQWVDERVVLRCIQVTSTAVHDVNFQHFSRLGDNILHDVGLEIYGIEVFMAT